MSADIIFYTTVTDGLYSVSCIPGVILIAISLAVTVLTDLAPYKNSFYYYLFIANMIYNTFCDIARSI